jgi:hypothetical protein
MWIGNFWGVWSRRWDEEGFFFFLALVALFSVFARISWVVPRIFEEVALCISVNATATPCFSFFVLPGVFAKDKRRVCVIEHHGAHCQSSGEHVSFLVWSTRPLNALYPFHTQSPRIFEPMCHITTRKHLLGKHLLTPSPARLIAIVSMGWRYRHTSW